VKPSPRAASQPLLSTLLASDYVTHIFYYYGVRSGVNIVPQERVARGKGASRRYPFHSHEGRDTLVTLGRRAGVDLAVVNFFVGHSIDRYGYDKSPWDDPEHFAEQYSKLSRYLNVVSGREELLKEQYDKTLQEQLKARDKEIEDIKHQQAVILDAIANGARVEPRLLRLQDTGIP
jgi:hypothetical protein